MKELFSLVHSGPVVVFDLEYTSWEGSLQRNWSGKGEYREVIQIGAVRVQFGCQPLMLGQLEVFVKPVKNPRLSAYIIELTGITQEVIETAGVEFFEAVGMLHRFAEGGRLPLLSFGDDFDDLQRNSKLIRVDLPAFEGKAFDITAALQHAGIDTRSHSSGTLLNALGASPGGRLHNALDDAKSIALAISMLLSRA